MGYQTEKCELQMLDKMKEILTEKEGQRRLSYKIPSSYLKKTLFEVHRSSYGSPILLTLFTYQSINIAFKCPSSLPSAEETPPGGYHAFRPSKLTSGQMDKRGHPSPHLLSAALKGLP
ncbi:hypothetical protein NPIL_458831 [Nephila pilipes]|uniref:Uncharacterized protein n=1 Tax=Nephila pilipes TaxID=299642 RepID=A0A8X6MI86_NEPPI|nr:hypothetical protein NPIL_458831 [Nephila pilipes]